MRCIRLGLPRSSVSVSLSMSVSQSVCLLFRCVCVCACVSVGRERCRCLCDISSKQASNPRMHHSCMESFEHQVLQGVVMFLHWRFWWSLLRRTCAKPPARFNACKHVHAPMRPCLRMLKLPAHVCIACLYCAKEWAQALLYKMEGEDSTFLMHTGIHDA